MRSMAGLVTVGGLVGVAASMRGLMGVAVMILVGLVIFSVFW